MDQIIGIAEHHVQQHSGLLRQWMHLESMLHGQQRAQSDAARLLLVPQLQDLAEHREHALGQIDLDVVEGRFLIAKLVLREDEKEPGHALQGFLGVVGLNLYLHVFI